MRRDVHSVPFNLNFRSTRAFSSDDSVQKQWRTVGQAAETPKDTSLGSTFFFLSVLLLMVLNWANHLSREMGRGRIFTWPKCGEENVFHLFQGGTGKQQLATDENKMLGNEEIRNTKELELIKINDQSIFGGRKRQNCFPLNRTSGEIFLSKGQNKAECTNLFFYWNNC